MFGNGGEEYHGSLWEGEYDRFVWLESSKRSRERNPGRGRQEWRGTL